MFTKFKTALTEIADAESLQFMNLLCLFGTSELDFLQK